MRWLGGLCWLAIVVASCLPAPVAQAAPPLRQPRRISIRRDTQPQRKLSKLPAPSDDAEPAQIVRQDYFAADDPSGNKVTEQAPLDTSNSESNSQNSEPTSPRQYQEAENCEQYGEPGFGFQRPLRAAYGDPNGNPESALAMIEAGFFFLKPFTDGTGTFDLQRIAPQSAGALNRLGATNLFNDFGFVPALTANYTPDVDMDGGVTVSGMGVTLNGDLNRSLDQGDSKTSVIEKGTITIISANAEGYFDTSARRDRYAHTLNRWGVMSRGQASDPPPNRFTIGGKFLNLTQTLHAQIDDPASGATLFDSSSQMPQGLLGITGSWQPTHLFYDREANTGGMALYGMARGSIVVGTVQRTTSISFTPADSDTPDTTITNDQTTRWIPVGEFELGILYRSAGQYRGQQRTVNDLKAAALFQIYGNAGLASSAGNDQFGSNNLYLIGGVVQAGF